MQVKSRGLLLCVEGSYFSAACKGVPVSGAYHDKMLAIAICQLQA